MIGNLLRIGGSVHLGNGSGGFRSLRVGLESIVLIVLVSDVDGKNEDDEHDRNDGGQTGKGLVKGLALGLAEEGFGTAGDGTGKTVGFPGLHQNRNDQKNSGNEKNDRKYDVQNAHNILLRLATAKKGRRPTLILH